MQLLKSKKKQVLPERELLAEAFAKFSEASETLQRKYESLCLEAMSLREKLAQKESEVKKAERLATLGETAAALAHEIRNPLGAMKLYVSLLRQDLQDQPSSLELVNAISTTAESLNHVVTNILQFAKTKTPVFAPVRIGSLLEELRLQITEQYRDMDIALEGDRESLLYGDEHGLRQVFTNLLLNSVQAQKSSGKVMLRIVADAKVIQVEVEDNGPGIPREMREKVFEPFVTSRNEGTGLGLAQ